MKVMSKVHKRQDYIIAPTKSRSQTTHLVLLPPRRSPISLYKSTLAFIKWPQRVLCLCRSTYQAET